MSVKPGLPYAYKPANTQNELELQPGITVLLVWLEVSCWKWISIASGKRYGMGDRKKLLVLQLNSSGIVSHCPSQLFRNPVDKDDMIVHRVSVECVCGEGGWEE